MDDAVRKMLAPELMGDEWLGPPGVYVDYFTYRRVNGLVRITFAEFVAKDTPPLHRVGIIMPIADAIVMADHLLKVSDLPNREDE